MSSVPRRNSIRRTLAVLVPVALVLSSLAAPPAYAADGETLLGWDEALAEVSVNPYATAASGPSVTLDGNLAEWASLPGIAGPSTTEQNKITPWSGPADLSYVARFGYDATNFYLGVTVTDDTHDPLPGGSNWSADGVQFAFGEGGSSRSEFGVAVADGVNDVQRYAAGASTLPSETIQLRGQTSGTTTSYEMVIPWRAVRSGAPSAGDLVAFTMIVNDSDGAGRKGYAEWTPGIGGTKDVTQFGKIELQQPDQTWTTWIAGPTSVMTGSSAEYALYVLNAGTDDLNLTLDLPALGITGAPVAVPGRRLFKKTMTTTVTATVDLTATLHAGAQTRTATRHVTALKTAAQLTALFDDIDNVVIPRLAVKLDKAKARHIATDYETANFVTIKQTSPYGRQDVAHDLLARAEYVANCLSALASEAEEKLDAYLAGRARPLGPVPRYRTGKTRPDGYAYKGTTTAGRNNPLIFSGYGMFEQVITDIPIFQDLGNNIIGFNVYPSEIFKKPGLTGWSTWTPAGSPMQFVLDDAQAHGGAYAGRLEPSGNNGILYQEPTLKPDTTYHLTAWTKTEGTPGAYLYSSHNGWTTGPITPSADWTPQEFTFTTGPDETRLQVGVFADQTGSVWVDDYTLTEDGSTTNLMANPDFESGKPPTDTYYVIDKTYLDNRVGPALRSAEQHNIAINLELGLQGFPEWVYQDYPDTRMQGNYGFLQADIENPRVQELYKAHVGVLMNYVKGSPAVKSVDLSNESEYQQNLGPYNLAKWHEYLPTVYRDVAAMNRTYGSSYTGFADVPVPDMTNVQQNALYFDYLTFKTERMTAFHKMLADEVHKYDPTMPVHTKLMGFGITNNDFMLKGGKDLEQFAGISQEHGFDGGPNYGGGPDKFAEYTGMLDMIASMKRMPLFNSENHLISDGEARYGPDIATWVGNWIWNGGLHGTSASLIWIWERDYQTDYLAGSILNRPDAIGQVSKASLDLNRLVDEVKAFQDADADVGLLFSMTPRLYSGTYYDTLTKAYKALSYTGQKVGYVTENQINGRRNANDLDHYKVLVLPEVNNLSADTLRSIAAWVRRGGRVVTIGDTAKLLTRDGHNQPLSERDRRAVLENARTLKIAANPADDDLRATFFGLLSSLHLNDTVVYDAATKQPVPDMEWRTVRHRGRTLLSLVNYSNVERSVYVKVHGQRVVPERNLVDGTHNRSSTVRVGGNGHAIYVLKQ